MKQKKGIGYGVTARSSSNVRKGRHFVGEVACLGFLITKVWWLKTTHISPQFLWVRGLGIIQLGLLLCVPQGYRANLDWTAFLSEIMDLFQTHLVVGRIHFLSVIGLRYLFSVDCQLGVLASKVKESKNVTSSVVSHSLWPHGQQPSRLLSMEFSRQE